MCETVERDGYLIKITESQICNLLGAGPTHLLLPTARGMMGQRDLNDKMHLCVHSLDC